jgi:hypothetical protein
MRSATCCSSPPAAPNADNAATAANAYADVYVDRAAGAEVVARAVAPLDPYEPDVTRSVLLAALAGLAIGSLLRAPGGMACGAIRSERQLRSSRVLRTWQ